MGCMVRVYLVLFLSAINKGSYCSIFSLAFDVVSILDFHHFNRCVVISHFKLQFPNNAWCEHIFTFLFSTCISSLIGGVLRSFAYFIIGKNSYCWIFKSSSYILHNSHLSNISFANIFSQIVVSSYSLDHDFQRP